MSYSQENGYVPVSFEDLIDDFMAQVNTKFGTAYTTETFLGTGYYKYAYGVYQKVQENEIKTSEIFLKLQEYIATTNDSIQRPSVSNPGIIDSLGDNGYIASVKPPINADAGKLFICVDIDDGDPDYPDEKLAICTLIKDYVAAGVVTQGTEVESIVLTNGQSFDFKFALPDRTAVLLRMTAVESENNQLLVPDDEAIRQVIFDNTRARYRLGKNFEPQRYYSFADAPWASSVKLEWSSNGGGAWNDTVFDAAFDDLFDFDLEDIAVLVS